MGQNAKIIVKGGAKFVISYSYLHSCEDTHMWDQIYVEPGGQLIIRDYSIIEDALIAVNAASNSAIGVYQYTAFNKNLVGIQMDTDVSTYGFGLSDMSFTCFSSMFNLPYSPNTNYSAANLNPPYNLQRSSAGIVLNNVRTNPTNILKIGVPLLAAPPFFLNYFSVYFVNLNYGIISNNSDFQANACLFREIDDPSNSTLTKMSVGSAIYINGLTNVQSSLDLWDVPSSIIGDDDVGYLRNSCSFINCKRGVYEKYNSNITCKGNNFDNMSLASVELNNNNGCILNITNNTSSDFFQGFRLINCLNTKQFLVFNNSFTLTNSSLTSSKFFANTGIYMANSPIGSSRASITSNIFNDVRIGVYTNGISNASVSDNIVNFNRSYTDLQNLNHVGFWTEGCSKSNYFNNTVTYSKLSSVPSGSLNSFKTIMRGFNIKGHTNSNFDYNFVNTCGTPMRLVGDVNQSFFSCNDFNGCINGILLQSANLSDQGTQSMSAGNKWRNYNPSTLRVIGSLSSGGIRNYFYEGTLSTSNIYYPYSTIPTFLFNIQQGGSSICNQFFSRKDIDISELDLVVLDSITIFDLTDREKERIAAFIALDEYVSTNTNYVNWKGMMETSDVGMYARLTDSTSHRLDIENGLRGLTGFEDPVFQYKRSLFSDALINQYYATDSIHYDSLSLDELANTNSWLGTSAVFLARAILEKEVDDEMNFLRLANLAEQQSNCDMSYSNYYDQLTLFSNEITAVDCFDLQGRLIEHFIFNYSKALSRNLLKDKNVFLMRMTTKECSKTFRVQ